MHFHSIQDWQHSHDFTTTAEAEAERRTRWVVFLTLATMVVELLAGWVTIEVHQCRDAPCAG